MLAYRWLVVVAALALAWGCGGKDGGGTAGGGSKAAPSSGGAGSAETPSVEANSAACKQLFGADAAKVFGLDALPEPDPQKYGMRPGVTKCIYNWPKGGPPKGLVQATFHCGKLRPMKDQMLKTWKRFEEVELGRPAYRLKMGGITQYWSFTDDCSVMATSAFSEAKPKGEAFAKLVFDKAGSLP